MSGEFRQDGPAGRGGREHLIRRAVDKWAGQLTDLGGRNRLLFYRDLKVGTLDLADAREEAMDQLLAYRNVRLSDLFAPEYLDAARTRARTIRDKTREMTEERGVDTCFLTRGMATWTPARGTAVPAAPVVLCQAAIFAVGAAETDFLLKLTGEAEINPTLVQLLREDFDVAVDPEALLDLIPETSAKDVGTLFEKLAKEAASVPGFAVGRRSVLGNFSFAKLPMVQDLRANAESLLEHDVIAALAGDETARAGLAGVGGPAAVNEPDLVAPQDEFLVLDADSSQSWAVNAALRGQNLVVKGPPGTGKSQTIANLIACLAARGRRVLFVAEKQAAIDAVLDRLDRVGLAGLVFDLHAGSRSRREVAQSLAAALRAAGAVPSRHFDQVHEDVVASRARLNAFADVIYRERGVWQTSIFTVQADLLALEQEHGQTVRTTVRLPAPVLARLDARGARQASEQLREYADLAGFTLTPQSTPWYGLTAANDQQATAAYATALSLCNEILPAAKAALDDAVARTRLGNPRTLDEWRSFAQLLADNDRVLTQLRPEAYSAPLEQFAAATATSAWRKQNTGWPGSRAGWGERRKLRRTAQTLWCAVGPAKTGDLHTAFVTACEVRQRWAAASLGGGLPRAGWSVLGGGYGHGFGAPSPGGSAVVTATFEQLAAQVQRLDSHFPQPRLAGLGLPALAETAQLLCDDQRAVGRLARLNALRSSFAETGLLQLVAELGGKRADGPIAEAIFRYCWNSSLLEDWRFGEPDAPMFDPVIHDHLVERFQNSDRQHVQTTAQRVLRATAEQLVRVRDAHPEQARLVEAEAQKKRRHLPLRDLVRKAPDVMTAVKPCWAMSPLSVSQLLPGGHAYFDVVIFDEASQVTPADAVPAISRARQVIVAGDEHQLPPTSFFGTAEAEDDEPSDGFDPSDGSGAVPTTTEGFESILDVMSAVVRQYPLNWHYRSHDERLIAFSNSWIYAPAGNRLTTFPGVAGTECVRLVPVEQRPGEPGQEVSVTAEVDEVVRLVCEHAEKRPGDSLGVITMGIKHKERIEAVLRRTLATRPDLEPFFSHETDQPFFVKNLERVQGDERDVIILSVGYGKTAEGRLPYRFGPLLQEGGQRRLNVAVTRARRQMTVVSSFTAADMDPNRSSAEGVRMLRAYLEFAAAGGSDLGSRTLDKPQLNGFEVAVRDRLTAAGIPLTPQYGVAGYWIDFAAAHPAKPGRMVLAIEADGATYHSSKTARDRDRLRQEQLERLGWTFHRIWSTDWFTDPYACTKRARAAYDRACEAADRDDAIRAAASAAASVAADVPVGPVVSAVPAASTAPVDETPESARFDDAVPDRRGRAPRVTPGAEVIDYTTSQLAAVIQWIESDTLLRTRDELFAEWMRALGWKRRGSRIDAAFDAAYTRTRPDRRP